MHIDFNAFLDSFYVMGMGMAGIFIVIVVLMLVLKGLTLLFPEKKDKNEYKRLLRPAEEGRTRGLRPCRAICSPNGRQALPPVFVFLGWFFLDSGEKVW